MPIHTFQLSRFTFPLPQPNNKTDFRLQLDFRYRRAAELETDIFIMPGPETHWDGEGLETSPGNVREIDLSKVSAWETKFRISADHLYEARAVVYDVKEPGIWSKIFNAVSKGAGVVPYGKEIMAGIAALLASDKNVEKLFENALEQRLLEQNGQSKPTWQAGGRGFYIQLDYEES